MDESSVATDVVPLAPPPEQVYPSESVGTVIDAANK